MGRCVYVYTDACVGERVHVCKAGKLGQSPTHLQHLGEVGFELEGL